MNHSAPTRSHRRSRRIPPSEQGYVLLAAIFFMTLLIISLAVAAPRVARSIQRDREVETFHRGMQYRRAIQLYFRKYHAYPPTVDALVKTQEIRFLRKRYIDPMTGKDDWKPIPYGQNKVPMAMGFFGQPLAGGATSIAGTGPSGGNALNPTGTPSQTLPQIFPSDNGGGVQAPAGASGTTLSANSGTPGVLGAAGASGTSGSSSSSSQSGQTFGGAGLVGFSPGSSKQSILVYKKKNHFNEWEFTYDPISDAPTIAGGNNPAGVGTQNSNGTGMGTGTGTGTGTGAGTGQGTGSGSNTSSGTGSNPAPSPTTP